MTFPLGFGKIVRERVVLMKDIVIYAESYSEFVKKVKEDVATRDMQSLVFQKAVSRVVVFKDKEGNRIDYLWEKGNEQNIPDER